MKQRVLSALLTCLLLMQLLPVGILAVDVVDLEAEAEKYPDVVRVSATLEEGDLISVLAPDVTASAEVTVTWNLLQASPWLAAQDGSLILAQRNDTARPVSVTAELTLQDEAEGSPTCKPITILLPPEKAAVELLMDTIAESYVDAGGEWVILDMAAYKTLKPGGAESLDTARQAYVNYAIGMVQNPADAVYDSEANVRAKAEIILRAIGGDTEKLYPVNSNTALNNPAKLRALEMSDVSMYDAPWVLLANLQGNLKLSALQTAALIQTLREAQPADGVYGYEWDGVYYPDVDTTAMALTALAAHGQSSGTAKAFVDAALTGLSEMQGENGSFGNANSDAMVILALVSLGIDPDGDSRFVKNGLSLMDGMLSYVNDASNGFTLGGSTNELATEQAFRALVAAAMMEKTGAAYQLYDFKDVTAEPLRATGKGSTTTPSDPTGAGTIQVTFTLRSAKSSWINQKNLALQEGSTVYHALIRALGDDFTVVGAESGYVRSITKLSTGETLAEFGQGKNSGWLYQVNGELPSVGLTAYTLSEGDSVLWYYATDYVKETGDSGTGGKIITTLEEEDEQEAEQAGQAAAFSDVAKDAWYYDAVMAAWEAGIFQGVDEDRFAPDDAMTRGMLAAVLFRMEGEPAPAGEGCFIDVALGQWYTSPIAWAAEQQLVSGYGNDTFGPQDPITREQLALLLMRYAQLKGMDVSGQAELGIFADAQEISLWAVEAMGWANQLGLIGGMGDGRLAPQAPATRAQTAAILLRLLEAGARL